MKKVTLDELLELIDIFEKEFNGLKEKVNWDELVNEEKFYKKGFLKGTENTIKAFSKSFIESLKENENKI